MKLLYAPAILSLVVLVSLGSQSLASTGEAEPGVSSDGERHGIPLETKPLFGILPKVAEVGPSEGRGIAKAPEGEVNPGKFQRGNPRGWHGDYYCPPCGRG